jgi:signal transduction histidine kinase
MRGEGLGGVELRRQGNGTRRTARREPVKKASALELAELAEHAPGVLLSMSLAGRVNAASAALCGHGPEHWVGRDLPEALGADAGRALTHALRALERGRSSIELEVRVRSPRGAPRMYRFRLAKRAGKHAAASAVSAFVADVTDELAREQALREREALLHRTHKSAALAYLAGGVAHDFNNLLTVIVGAADLLREDPRVESELRAEIAQIHRAGERASEITQQLLAYSRREPSVPRELNLGRAVQELLGLLGLCLGASIRLELSLAPDLWQVHIDPLHVEHVLSHLALHARQVMPHGGVLWLSLSNVTIASFERHAGLMVGPGHYVQLQLRDTGAGLSEAALGRVFEPFFAAPPGTGSVDLGLPLVRYLVVHAFGHVWVESEPGRGSTFTLLLPRAGERRSLVPEPVAVSARSTANARGTKAERTTARARATAPERAPARRGKKAAPAGRGARASRKA